MPLPNPKKDQTESEFVSSCMGDKVMNKEYPDQKQRLAICYSQFKRAKKQKAKGNLNSVSFEEHNDMGLFIVLHDEID